MKQFIREAEVRAKAGGVARSTLWRWERAGVFPKRIRLGPQVVGWLESEVDGWISERTANRDEAVKGKTA